MALVSNVSSSLDDGKKKKKEEFGGHSGSFGAGSSVSSGSNTAAAVAQGLASATGNSIYKNTGAELNKNLGGSTSSGGRSGGGGGSSSSTPAAATPNYDTTIPSDYNDPELLAQYQAAMQALEQMKGQAPTYGSQYDDQIQSLYQQIMGRGAFKYDQKTDPLYQQYVQDYTMGGKTAMRDTMGQAAALTGGYGSSYAQAVGQQQYDNYLQKLADILPETYSMALNAWEKEGDLLNSKLATTTDLEKSDYNRYLDALNQHNIDLDRAQTDADNWYTRMTAKEKENYNRSFDSYDRLLSLMSVGYKPSMEEYNAAGLSQAQGEAIRAAYAAAAQPVQSSGGARRSAKTQSETEDELTRELANMIGGMGKTTTTNAGSAANQIVAGLQAQAAADKINQAIGSSSSGSGGVVTKLLGTLAGTAVGSTIKKKKGK